MDRRTVFRRFTIAGFMGFTLVVIGVFIRQGWIAEQARDQVRHTYEVREEIEDVFVRIKDLEIGQRGYALSGDSAYLEPYLQALYGRGRNASPGIVSRHDEGVKTVWDHARNLRYLVADNPQQAARADSLMALVRQRVAYADYVIHVRQTQGIEATVALAKRGGGKRIMDDTRALVSEMYEVEEVLLQERTEVERERLRANSLLLYGVVALFYVAWLSSLRIAARSRLRRLRAERELRESNQLLQATIHSGNHAIFSTDMDGKILLFNTAAERMLGYLADEVVGKRSALVLSDIHDRDQLERRRRRLEKRLGRPVRGMELFTAPPGPDEAPDPEWTLIRRSGERFLASMVVSPMLGPDGHQFGYLCILRDVTERRLLERKVAESNTLLNAVIHGTDYAVFVADPFGILQIFSQGAERMLGYKGADFVGKPVMEATANIFLPEEMAARAERIVKQYGRPPEGVEIFNLPLDDDGPFGQEWTNIRADGSRITASVAIWELRGDDGRLQGSVAIARDITALKALDRMKSEFISTVSHELRTPLTSIRGALGLVSAGAAGVLPTKAAELVAIAHRNSERLVRIINDILDIEKIDSGRLSIQLRPVEVEDILKQAVEVNQAYGEKYGVRFVVHGEPPKAGVLADPDRLMQILSNLLSNAAKFSASGSEVWLGAEARGTFVRFTVRDFGKGIPADFRGRVFEKFAQAEGDDTRSRDGTGLGLNITKKLVEAMQGTIDFTSAEGKGTEFYFELPQVLDLGHTANAAGAPPRARVLICEDDPDVGTLLRLLLERGGLEADVVGTIAETRRMLRENTYAALTLDLILPDGSGLTLLRVLRRDPKTQDLPVIVISAKAEEGRRELNGDAIGMIDWMTKPIQEDMLTASLRRAMALSSKPRILHVEDDGDFREILARSLQGEAEWIGAASLREANALLEGDRFDLVVLDLDLPDGSGLELLEQLKNLPWGPVPVLILSASETDNGIRKKVEAALVKSRLSEERIVETILAQIQKQSGKHGPANDGAPA